MSLHIIHLFPNELGLFGDSGNVLALRKRAEWSGIETRVTSVNLDDGIPTNGDIYVIGSGSTAGIRQVAERCHDIARALDSSRANGSTILAISAGIHLLSNRIDFSDGSHVTGAGMIDAIATPLRERRVGEVFDDYAGFVNTGHVLTDGDDSLVWERNGIVGTYLHGPFLPMNPGFADVLIARHSGSAVDHADPRVARATVAAEKSRDAIRKRLGL